MKLGLVKTSLVDYPGRVASVVFTSGCNFRCPYCQNPDLVVRPATTGGLSAGGDRASRGAAAGRDLLDARVDTAFPGDDAGLLSVDEVLSFLATRAGLVTGVVVTGGEPTLHTGLPGLVAAVQRSGFAVKLDTNGSAPERIAAAGADYIAMDLKTAPGRYAELWPSAGKAPGDVIAESVNVVRQLGVGFEFRITCAPGFVGREDAIAIAALLRPEDHVFLQRYRPGRVLDPVWAASVSPYTDAHMAEVLAIIKSAAPLARIRGL